MADGKVIKLGILLELLDKVSGPAGKINRNFKTTQHSAQELSGSMTKLAAGVTAAGAALLALPVIALRSTFDTQKALGELASLGIKNLRVIEDAATRTSNEISGVTKASFITAAYDIKSGISSLSDEAVGEYTRIASLTAKATKGTAEVMTSLFATSYGIYKNFYGKMSDIDFGKMLSGGIAEAVRAFKTTGPGMAQAIEALGASATTSGAGMPEQFAILGMLQATMPGAEAGTKYQAFIKGATKAQKELGLKFTDSNNRLLPMADILDIIRGKFGDVIDANERLRLMQAFGRMEGVQALELLIDKTSQLRENTDMLSRAMGKGMGKTEEMAEAMEKMRPGEKWQTLIQQVHNLWEIAGGAVIQPFINIVGYLSKIVLWLQRIGQAHPQLMRVAMAGSAMLGVFLMLLGGLLGFGVVIIKLSAGLGGLKLAFQGLQFALFAVRYFASLAGAGIVSAIGQATAAVWAFLTTNPIGWIILAISAIVMFALAWKNNWLGIGTFMNKVVAGIASGFVWLWNQIMTGVNWIISLPGKLYEAGKKMVLSIWEGIKSVAMMPVNAAKSIALKIRNLWPFSPAKEGPLKDLGKVGYAFADQLSVGIMRGTGRIRKAAVLAAMAAVPAVATPQGIPLFGIPAGNAADIAAITGIPSANLGAMDIRKLAQEAQTGWNISHPKESTVSGIKDNSALGGAGDMGSNLGGSASMPSVIYITQHFERDSIVLTGDIKDFDSLADKIGKQLVRKIVMEAK